VSGNFSIIGPIGYNITQAIGIPEQIKTLQNSGSIAANGNKNIKFDSNI
jgi:hypothetical protein